MRSCSGQTTSIASQAGATVIELEENVGFGRAVNLVAERSSTPWIAPANADVALAATFGMVSPGSRDALRSQIDGLVPALVVTQAPTSYTPDA